MILRNEELLRLFTLVFIDLMIRGFELVTRAFELVTCTFEFQLALLSFQLVTRNSQLVFYDITKSRRQYKLKQISYDSKSNVDLKIERLIK